MCEDAAHEDAGGDRVRALPRPRVADAFELVGVGVGALFLDAAGPILLDDVANRGYVFGGELEEADAVRFVQRYGGEAGFEGGFDIGGRSRFGFSRDRGFRRHSGLRMVMEGFVGNHGGLSMILKRRRCCRLGVQLCAVPPYGRRIRSASFWAE